MSLLEDGPSYYFHNLVYGIREERIRERDDAGRVVATGLRWRQFSERKAAAAVGFVLVGLVIGSMPLWAKYPVAWSPVLAFGFLFLSIGGWFADGIYRQWEIRFLPDGTMATPHGFTTFKRRKTISGTHHNVVSIEAKPPRAENDPWGHRVELFGAGGEVVWVAAKLDEFEARKIALQLIHALNEIREAGRVEDPAPRLQAARQWSNSAGPGVRG